MRGQWLDEGLRAYNCLVLDFRLIIFRFAQVSEFSRDLQFNQRTELSVFFFLVVYLSYLTKAGQNIKSAKAKQRNN